MNEPLVSPRPDIAALEGYHSKQVDVGVRLNTNESPFGPPVGFVDEWLADLRTVPLHRYPDRDARDLRAALAGRLSQPAERVFCANGSNEDLQTLLLTSGGAGRSGAVFAPTYPLHSHIGRLTGTRVVTGERGPDFLVDPDAAVELVVREQPSVVFLCSPNNPTGAVEPPRTIERLLESTEALVVVDEAYGEFSDWSAADLVADDRRLVVSRTYSKVWSMAALRLGFCIAPEWVVDELEKVVLPYHLAVATQRAGVLALEYQDEMDDRVRILVDERERLFAELAQFDGVTAYPSGANFVLIRFASPDIAVAVWEQLVELGVLVRDFARWPRLEGCLRVTVGAPTENAEFLTALRKAVAAVGEDPVG